MALPSSGSLSFSQIQTEFGGSNPIALSEYYNNTSGLGLNISANYSSIPASGAIAVSDFYGAQKFDLYPTTTFVTTTAPAGTQAVNVSSTSSMKDRWMIVCFGGWNSDVDFNYKPTIDFTTGATGSATVTAVNQYSYPASDGYSNGIAYRKIADGATSVTIYYTQTLRYASGGQTGDGTPLPDIYDYGSINAAVYVVTGAPTLAHYGLQSTGSLNSATGSITLNATSTKSFCIFTAWRNRTPFTITNATIYPTGSEQGSGYNLNPPVGNTTYTTIVKGTFHGILFNY